MRAALLLLLTCLSLRAADVLSFTGPLAITAGQNGTGGGGLSGTLIDIGGGKAPDPGSLPGAVLYLVIGRGVTNLSGVVPAGQQEAVSGWADQSRNHYPVWAGSVSPTNWIYGNPTNGPWIEWGNTTNIANFNNQMLVSPAGGISYNQPNTFIFVMKDLWTGVGGGGCVINGYLNNFTQWNYSAGPAENIYAGINAQFLTLASQTGWPGAGFAQQHGIWAVYTVQFNGTSSLWRINGQQFPVGSPLLYNAGTQIAQGLTLGNYQNGTGGAICGICAMLWLNGAQWTDPASLLYVEEILGRAFGISVL